MGELAAAVLTGEAPRFHPHTGSPLTDAAPARRGGTIQLSPSARAGWEAPRFCQICGRRMVVRIHPMGWAATCSRHGVLDSTRLEH